MELYQFIKQQREASGLTVEELCEKVNISTGAFVEYQNGKKSLLSLPFEKALRFFPAIDIEIDKFYDEYFPELRQETEKEMVKWREEHPVELNLGKLKRRYRAWIAKVKERRALSEAEIEFLLHRFKKTFNELEPCANENGMISEILYKDKILPLSYVIKQKLESGKIKNDVSNLINDAVLKNEITYMELGEIVGVTPRRLTMCKTSLEGYSCMKMGSLLKICYALNVPFENVQSCC